MILDKIYHKISPLSVMKSHLVDEIETIDCEIPWDIKNESGILLN